jgi:hypothetical protein
LHVGQDGAPFENVGRCGSAHTSVRARLLKVTRPKDEGERGVGTLSRGQQSLRCLLPLVSTERSVEFCAPYRAAEGHECQRKQNERHDRKPRDVGRQCLQ